MMSSLSLFLSLSIDGQLSPAGLFFFYFFIFISPLLPIVQITRLGSGEREKERKKSSGPEISFHFLPRAACAVLLVRGTKGTKGTKMEESQRTTEKDTTDM
jgi:hypothetical protein